MGLRRPPRTQTARPGKVTEPAGVQNLKAQLARIALGQTWETYNFVGNVG